MIRWQMHTGYDFFISLYVLHHPKRFGLRASWAAGVRQRLDDPHRLLVEKIQQVVFVPLRWLATLPEKGEVAEALAVLESMPPEEAFDHLFRPPRLDETAAAILEALRYEKELNEEAREYLRLHYRHDGHALKDEPLEALIAFWRTPEETMARYLAALKAYQRVFFYEEEARILPYLERALTDARLLAEKTSLPDLLVRLSHGVHLAALDKAEEITLAPSFWSAPLIFTAETAPQAHVFVFGARPKSVNLVPGVPVPEDLVSRLKALSDATRLRILKSLLIRPATATELARQLRLRPPTLVHHLRILRLAGLVQITISAGHEQVYALRAEGLLDVQKTLMTYLSRDE